MGGGRIIMAGCLALVPPGTLVSPVRAAFCEALRGQPARAAPRRTPSEIVLARGVLRRAPRPPPLPWHQSDDVEVDEYS